MISQASRKGCVQGKGRVVSRVSQHGRMTVFLLLEEILDSKGGHDLNRKKVLPTKNRVVDPIFQ